MQQTKRLLSLGMILLVVVVLSIAGTLAYLNDGQTVNNLLQFGNVKLEITDTSVGSPSTAGKIVPGNAIATTPTIKNVGDVPCYLRARVVFSADSAENGTSAPFQEYVQIGKVPNKWDWSGFSFTSGTPSFIYYTERLEPNESTDQLYQTLGIALTSGGKPLLEGVNKNFKVSLDISAVQVVGADGQVIASPKDAFETLLPAS